MTGLLRFVQTLLKCIRALGVPIASTMLFPLVTQDSSTPTAQDQAETRPEPQSEKPSVWKELGLPEPNPNAPYAKPPELKLLFEDDFSTDTRGNYENGEKDGTVTWKAGKLVLSDGAVVSRKIKAGPRVIVDLNWEWPELEPGESSVISMTFAPTSVQAGFKLDVIASGTPTTVRFARQRRSQVSEVLEIQISAAGAPPETAARLMLDGQSDLAKQLLTGCQIEYNHGLVAIVSAGKRVQLFYDNLFPADIATLELNSHVDSPTLTGIHVQATQGTPEFTIVQKMQLVAAAASDVVAVNQLEQGRYAEAVESCKKSVETCERVLGEFHFYTVTARGHLSTAYWENANDYLTERLIIENNEILENLLSSEHPELATSLQNLAVLRLKQGRATETEPVLEQVLAMRMRVFPGDHPDVASSLENLALVRQSLGRPADAEPLHEQALAMYQRLFPSDHPDLARSLNNLAAMRKSLGRAAEAELLFGQALAMCQRFFPDDHPAVALSLQNLASMQRAAEAEPLLEQSLAMHQRLFPGDHPQLALNLSNLAQVRESLGRTAEAEPLLEQALAMRKRLFPGDHPDVANGLQNLASVRYSLGREADAELLFEQALAMRKRLFPGDHPEVAISLHALAFLHASLDRPAEAEPLYEQALAMIERIRTLVRGAAVERAALSGELMLSPTAKRYASVLTALGKTQQALASLERGSNRAGLDLFAGGRGAAEQAFRLSSVTTDLARYDAALVAETVARSALLEAEARMGKAPDSEKKDWFEKVRAARSTLSEKTAAVFNELRGLVPQVSPLTTHEILAALGDDQGLITWAWGDFGPVVLVARDSEVHGFKLATGKEESTRLAETVVALRAWASARPNTSNPENDPVVNAAREAILPVAVREKLVGLQSLIVVPDGPVQGIPLELLIHDIPISYAPSATIAINRQRAAESRTEQRTGAVVLGDPRFGGTLVQEKKYPETGALLAMVQEGGNAASAGMARGDVLLRYGDVELKSAQDLSAAIATVAGNIEAETVPVQVWRDGDVIDVNVQPGLMGVMLHQATPADGLRSMEVLDRSGNSLSAKVSALEQIRLYGGTLTPLSGTRLEATAVAGMYGSDATLLLGPDASSPALNLAVEARPPRVLHLATHGLMGSADKPLLASLALATPAEPTPGDTGFVTLEDILSTWGARLNGTELVVLSACDSGRGVQQGDTSMALPLGLFVCGAETVIASQWKVDDMATALLMSRFYANWLGKSSTPREIDGIKYEAGAALPKLAALREAQAWLRGLTREQVTRLTSATSAAEGNEAATTNVTRCLDQDQSSKWCSSAGGFDGWQIVLGMGSSRADNLCSWQRRLRRFERSPGSMRRGHFCSHGGRRRIAQRRDDRNAVAVRNGAATKEIAVIVGSFGRDCTAFFAVADPQTSLLGTACQHAAIGTRVGSGPAFSPTGQTAWRSGLDRIHWQSAQPGVDHPSPWSPTDSRPSPPIKEADPFDFSKGIAECFTAVTLNG